MRLMTIELGASAGGPSRRRTGIFPISDGEERP